MIASIIAFFANLNGRKQSLAYLDRVLLRSSMDQQIARHCA